jgi:tetratricopeptide (TPR) repeat protein
VRRRAEDDRGPGGLELFDARQDDPAEVAGALAMLSFDTATRYLLVDDVGAWKAGQLEPLERALADYDAALEADPGYGSARHGRGLVLARRGEFDRAVADFNAALASGRLHRQEQAQVRDDRGVAYADAGELDRALADFGAAVNLDPGNAKAYNDRGYAHELKGEYELARRDYRKAAELDPRYAAPGGNLAALEARLGGAPAPARAGSGPAAAPGPAEAVEA